MRRPAPRRRSWTRGRPPRPSNSHTAAFYYTATDDATPLIDIVFECRIDTTDPLLWEDCEYPAIFSNLSPGPAHRRDPRRRHQPGRRLDADQGHVDVRAAAVRRGSRHVHRAQAAAPRRRCSRRCSRSRPNEPDTTFECQVDALGWQPCGQEQPPEVIIDYSFFEAEFEEFEIGPHTFRVRAIDIEGRPDPTPAEYTWVIAGGPLTTILSGPADEPTFEIGEPLNGGQTHETTATFTYASDNEPDSTFECSLDLAPFVPCNDLAPPVPPATETSVHTVTYDNLLVGEHIFRVFATSPDGAEELEAVEYEWEVLTPLVNEPPVTVIADAPANNSSQVMFEFTGTDDITPPDAARLRVRAGHHQPGRLHRAVVSPFNVLELTGARLASRR